MVQYRSLAHAAASLAALLVQVLTTLLLLLAVEPSNSLVGWKFQI
jgi:hypothetical protein